MLKCSQSIIHIQQTHCTNISVKSNKIYQIVDLIPHNLEKVETNVHANITSRKQNVNIFTGRHSNMMK